jgi:hypothetical protein
MKLYIRILPQDKNITNCSAHSPLNYSSWHCLECAHACARTQPEYLNEHLQSKSNTLNTAVRVVNLAFTKNFQRW